MSHVEETWSPTIRKSTKDIGQCTNSNQTNSNFGKNAKKHTLCLSYSPLQHVVNTCLNWTYC